MKCFVFNEDSLFNSGTAPVVMYAMGSDVRAFQLNQDHQFAFISGEKRIQAIDFDVTKGKIAF